MKKNNFIWFSPHVPKLSIGFNIKVFNEIQICIQLPWISKVSTPKSTTCTGMKFTPPVTEHSTTYLLPVNRGHYSTSTNGHFHIWFPPNDLAWIIQVYYYTWPYIGLATQKGWRRYAFPHFISFILQYLSQTERYKMYV